MKFRDYLEEEIKVGNKVIYHGKEWKVDSSGRSWIGISRSGKSKKVHIRTLKEIGEEK